MGCTSSKLDDLPAVALCRERCTFLDEAIRQRYSLAGAHVLYMQSLINIGLSLHHFFDQDLDASTSQTPSSPVLPLPNERKGGPNPNFVMSRGPDLTETSGLRHHSHSNSGSHLEFHSDSDDDDEGSSLGSLHHSSNHNSPLHHTQYNHHDEYGTMNHDEYGTMNHDPTSNYPNGFMHMNYMKKKATPSVSYEQRPMSPETMHIGQSSYYPPYPYSNENPATYSYYGYSNYGSGNGMNSYYGGASLPPSQQTYASSSKPPPPMPSPEKSSAWDLFNPFEYDKYYNAYTPSRDSKEVREEEGIPDLEYEDYREEIVKEAYGDHKIFNGDAGNYSKTVINGDDGNYSKTVSTDNKPRNKKRQNVPVENEGIEYEVHVVEKKVVQSEKSEEQSNVGKFKARGGGLGVFEVVKEIQVQFERASESGNELSTLLEVGKLQYNRKHAAYQVSSRLLNVIPPTLSVVSSQPSTSTTLESSSATNNNSVLFGFEEETGIKLNNLSSTLQKLYLWEKKLYNEVKAEEKMRIIHERKRRKLKRLDEKGAEADKVETTRTLIRSLSTKIKISIQVVDKISITINKIRDEELWPLLNELINSLAKMWKSMLDCHHNQCQAIKEIRSFDTIASHKKPGEAQLEATIELERQLINLTLRFSNWISAQKGYVRALNNWLLKCLLYEPEETPDGIVPFSPGRIGAPPVFVICNQWAQALDKISEKEVINSMRFFAGTVLQFWDRDKLVFRQGMIGNKDMERKVRNLDKVDHKIKKEIQALEKKMILGSSGYENNNNNNVLLFSEQTSSVQQSDTSSLNSLQASLEQVFEAMERFAASCTKAYEELWQRNEEERLVRENGNNS